MMALALNLAMPYTDHLVHGREGDAVARGQAGEQQRHTRPDWIVACHSKRIGIQRNAVVRLTDMKVVEVGLSALASAVRITSTLPEAGMTA